MGVSVLKDTGLPLGMLFDQWVSFGQARRAVLFGRSRVCFCLFLRAYVKNTRFPRKNMMAFAIACKTGSIVFAAQINCHLCAQINCHATWKEEERFLLPSSGFRI
jgi:hypothetical protein